MSHVDVLIVGAGLAGIGAAWRLQQEHPTLSYAVLEGRDAIGGTWDLFRYPGVRSDSDMFTLSYPFRPWTGADSIADGASIRAYVEETAREAGIDRHIRFGTTAVSASWSSTSARWTVQTSGDAVTCGFLHVCAGYYAYDHGHRPEFRGVEEFAGRVVHPQFWPPDLDHADRRVVVIGSGATAVTLVPAMARTAAHVTMLQRSPSYVAEQPRVDRAADALRRHLPARAAHALIRGKNVLLGRLAYAVSRRFPEHTRRHLRAAVLRRLPDPAYVDEHFGPRYRPWDQRLCVVPDGDLFDCLTAGRASVVTDRIDRFDPGGIVLASGERLDADVVVTATGLDLLPLGGLALAVDGRPVVLGDTLTYRGVLLDGVPNLAFAVGYTNASWTLRTDLSARYVARLLRLMRRHGYVAATPSAPPGVARRSMLGLDSGYVRRAAHLFPRQGDRAPWTVRQDYPADLLATAVADLRRDMVFTGGPPAPGAAAATTRRPAGSPPG